MTERLTDEALEHYCYWGTPTRQSMARELLEARKTIQGLRAQTTHMMSATPADDPPGHPQRCDNCKGRTFAKIDGSDAFRCVECKEVITDPAPQPDAAERLTDEALEKMAALYDRRVAQHDAIKDVLCGRLRSENGQMTRDIHAATASALRELLAHRRATPADDLRAENERLREALDEADHALGQMGIFEDASIRVKLKRARAALSQNGGA